MRRLAASWRWIRHLPNRPTVAEYAILLAVILLECTGQLTPVEGEDRDC
jgi:hypothetical protein